MPKFLDIPSWYGTDGTLLYPLSYSNNSWPNGLTMGSLQLNGDASIPIFTDESYNRQWYAPTEAGTTRGQVIKWDGVASNVPYWGNISTTNPVVPGGMSIIQLMPREGIALFYGTNNFIIGGDTYTRVVIVARASGQRFIVWGSNNTTKLYSTAVTVNLPGGEGFCVFIG